ncbi:hypothetical protein WJX79_004293 [Trebouxia sp. C0005]
MALQKTDTMLKEEAAADTEDSRYKQAALDFVKNDDFPIELICPITQTLIYDPVLTVQGNVYERAAITEWLQTHTTDPLTNAHLTVLTLIPCNPIKSEIEAFKAEVRKLGPEAAARLELPRMDNWTLGVWKNNSLFSSAPTSGSRLDRSRPLLSQVHTVLLIDDSGSMLEQGSSGWGGSRQSGATRVRPWGGTPLGLRINTILDGYMSSLRYERDLKPLNLVVITDGHFEWN